MKYVLFLVYFICFGISSITAQVTDLKYLLKYNCENNLYDVKIKITSGSANSVTERVQFNSQITILIPTGIDFEIVEKYQPLENNQQYSGTVPTNWVAFPPIISPTGHEKYDFYSVAPNLIPASFFNDIEEGDEITIFSFELGGDAGFDERVRFFDNTIDEKLSLFEGTDLRNGYSLGGAADRYIGNLHEDCIVSSTLDKHESEVSIYPNPTESEVVVRVSEDIKSIRLVDYEGTVLETKNNVSQSEVYVFDVSQLTGGIYFIQLDNGIKTTTQKLMILQR